MRHQLTAFKIKPKDRIAGPFVGFCHFDRADLAQANAMAVTRMADDVVFPGCILQQPVFPQFAVFEKAVGLAACRVDVQVGIRNVCYLLKGHIRQTVRPVCKNRAGEGYIDAAKVGACRFRDMVPPACVACATVVHSHFDAGNAKLRRR